MNKSSNRSLLFVHLLTIALNAIASSMNFWQGNYFSSICQLIVMLSFIMIGKDNFRLFIEEKKELRLYRAQKKAEQMLKMQEVYQVHQQKKHVEEMKEKMKFF